MPWSQKRFNSLPCSVNTCRQRLCNQRVGCLLSSISIARGAWVWSLVVVSSSTATPHRYMQIQYNTITEIISIQIYLIKNSVTNIFQIQHHCSVVKCLICTLHLILATTFSFLPLQQIVIEHLVREDIFFLKHTKCTQKWKIFDL